MATSLLFDMVNIHHNGSSDNINNNWSTESVWNIGDDGSAQLALTTTELPPSILIEQFFSRYVSLISPLNSTGNTLDIPNGNVFASEMVAFPNESTNTAAVLSSLFSMLPTSKPSTVVTPLFDQHDQRQYNSRRLIPTINGDGGDQSWPVTLAWSLLFFPMIALAVVGNLLIIWIIATKPLMRTAMNCYLLNLAVSDLFSVTFNAGFNFVFMLNQHWPFGKAYCFVNNFITNLTIGSSVCTIMLISLDRYNAIVHPLQPRQTYRRLMISISLVWISSIVFSLPTLLFSDTMDIIDKSDQITRTLCLLRWPDGISGFSTYEFLYNLGFLVFFYLVPMLTMVFGLILMSRVLWPGDRIGEHTTQSQQALIRSKRKIVCMLICVIAVFGLCWLPYHSYFIGIYLWPNLIQFLHIKHIYLAFYWFAMANSLFNPIILFVMNRRIRNYILNYLKFKCLINCLSRDNKYGNRSSMQIIMKKFSAQLPDEQNSAYEFDICFPQDKNNDGSAKNKNQCVLEYNVDQYSEKVSFKCYNKKICGGGGDINEVNHNNRSTVNHLSLSKCGTSTGESSTSNDNYYYNSQSSSKSLAHRCRCQKVRYDRSIYHSCPPMSFRDNQESINCISLSCEKQDNLPAKEPIQPSRKGSIFSFSWANLHQYLSAKQTNNNHRKCKTIEKLGRQNPKRSANVRFKLTKKSRVKFQFILHHVDNHVEKCSEPTATKQTTLQSSTSDRYISSRPFPRRQNNFVRYNLDKCPESNNVNNTAL